MRRFALLYFFILAFALEAATPASVFSTWNNVLTCRANGNGQPRAVWSGFFFNEFVGFVGSAGDAGIYKTTDGGKTWLRTTIPAGYNGNITQIFMTDQNLGWATIEEPGAGKKDILKTIDGGLNWVAVGPNGYFSSVYQTPLALVVTSRLIGGSGLISLDGGQTFQNNVIAGSNGVDFVDNLHGVITGFKASRWKKTVDGGVIWSDITPFQTTESWSVYGQKGTPNFFASPEQDPTSRPRPGTSSVVISTDYGSTWATQAVLTFYSTGGIAGAANAIYVQADSERALNNNIRGVFRSTDNGKNWTSVGGPSTSQDSRFVVTGCKGGVVYAFDGLGNVWKTRDGGDGAIIEPPIELQITGEPVTLNGRICSTTSFMLKFSNLYCEDDSLISIDLVDPTSNLFTSGALSITKMPTLPALLESNEEDSIVLSWEPFKLFHRDTIVTTQIRLHYYSKILQRFVDTVVNFSAHAIGDAPTAILTPPLVNFGNVKFCTPYDTIITLKNLGCDTLSILGAIAGPPANYTILDVNGLALPLPIILAPNDTTQIRIRVNLSNAGNFANTLTLQLSHQGIKRDTLLALSAVVSSVGSYALTDSILLDPISICTSLDTTAFLKNLACKDIIITGAQLKNGVEFTLSGAPPYTTPVIAGATGVVRLHFASAVAGAFTDELTIQFTTLGEAKTAKIFLKGSVFSSPASLVASRSLDTLFDLALTRCDSPLTFPFVFSNPSCDKKITISKVSLQPANNPDVRINNLTLPATVFSQTNQTLPIIVSVAPKTIGNHSGTITVTYQIEGDIPRDTTIAYFLNVGYGTRILDVDKDSIYLGRFRFCETRDTVVRIQNLGCDSLDIFYLTVSGQGNFTVTSTTKKILATNESFDLAFHFEPTSAGRVGGNIVISSNADKNDTLRVIPVIADVIPTDTLSFSIKASRVNFYAGDTVSFLLVPNRNVKNKGINQLLFNIGYNSDLLTLLGSKVQLLLPNATYIVSPNSGTAKHTLTRIYLTGIPTLEFDSLVPIMKILFSTALTDTVTTTMGISDVQINGGNPTFAKCELGVISADITYTLNLLCGDSTLIKYMQLGRKFALKTLAVNPDPVTENNNFHARLPFEANVIGVFSVSVFDAVGKLVLTKDMTTDHSGSFDLDIDASKLSSGSYHYILKHLETKEGVEGSFRVTR